MLRVRLSGGLELDHDGTVLAAPRSRRGRLLLAWLALRPGAHARGEVAGRFWPDVLDESARASLRVALSELRAGLGPASGCLVATRDTVALVGDELWVDVRAFDSLLAAGRDAEAVAACPGELLTGLGEDWVLDARQEHTRRLGAAHARLAGAAEARGDPDVAVRHARSAVALDPLAEEPSRLLIELLDRAGEPAAALAAYDRLAERLRGALAIPPSAATRALADRIRGAAGARGDAPGVPAPIRSSSAARPTKSLSYGAPQRGRRGHARRVSPRAGRAAAARPTKSLSYGRRSAAGARGDAPGVPAPAALRRPYESDFVGRAAELERIGAAWADARARAGRRIVLLAGEPGIGKTRLALEFARTAAGAGATVLAGRCWEEPLGACDPFAEALRQCAGALGADGVAALAGPTAGELGRLLGTAPEPGADDPGARHRLFDAVDAVLAGLAARRPLLLWLDDLHWADRPTLLLLAFVLRSPRPGPLLVLGTYRDTEVGRRTPLAGALGELARDGALDRIALHGLGADEVEALAAAWLGRAAAPGVAAAVHHRTAGNAFFAEEVLRGLAGSGDDAAPESVRHAVGTRLERLGEPAGRLLDVAAVLRGEFPADLLAAVSGLAPASAEDALDELLAARLLRPCAGAPRQFEFPHALVAEVVYGELNALRRSRLHRQVAEELIARAPERQLEEIAHHLFESAAAGDERRTADYVARAGRRALAALSYEAAADHFDRALQLVGPDGGLLVERGDALLRAGEREPARASFRAAAELARAAGDPVLLARAALGHAGLGATIIAVDAATVALLEEALAALGDDAPELRARVLAQLAVELYYAPSRDRSEGLSAAAVTVARTAGDERTLASALGARHVALWRPDRLRERLDAARAMIAAATAAGDQQLELQARNWLVSDLFEAGDMAAWRAEVERHGALAEQLRLAAYAWYTPLWHAVDAIHAGRFDEGRELRERARELGTRAGDGNAELFGQMLVYADALLRRDYSAVDLAWVEDKIEHSAAGQSYRAGYAWVLAELGRPAEARAQLAHVIAHLGDLPFDANWPSAVGELADAVVRLDEPEHASLLAALLAPFAGRHLTAGRAVMSYGVADRQLACLAALEGRRADAERLFEEALRGNRALGMTPWVERTASQRAALMTRFAA